MEKSKQLDFGQQIKAFFDLCPKDGNDREIGYHEKSGLFYINNITNNSCYFVDVNGGQITGSEHDGKADNTITSLYVKNGNEKWVVKYDSENRRISFAKE